MVLGTPKSDMLSVKFKDTINTLKEQIANIRENIESTLLANKTVTAEGVLTFSPWWAEFAKAHIHMLDTHAY